jgi:hypothetical protein
MCKDGRIDEEKPLQASRPPYDEQGRQEGHQGKAVNSEIHYQIEVGFSLVAKNPRRYDLSHPTDICVRIVEPSIGYFSYATNFIVVPKEAVLDAVSRALIR